MSFLTRPVHQWFLGVLVVAFLIEPIISWAVQLVELIGGCGDGFGNPGMSGELIEQHCSLFVGQRAVAEIPWIEDVWITSMLLFVLLCVLLSLLVPRWSKWSHGLAIVAVPVLTFVGLTMAGRGVQRLDGEIFDYMILPPAFPDAAGYSRTHDGWVLNFPVRDVWIPDVGGLSLGLSFFAGLGLLVLVSALLADYQRRRGTGPFRTYEG